MKNPSGKKLDKILFKLFDQMIEGVDQYNHSGSLWIIFTNERQWVVEYTEGGTLWYNYKLFKNEMELVGMDCVENKEYITRWFEDRFLNKPKVDKTWDNPVDVWYQIEDTIQNGVKDTKTLNLKIEESIEDTIQNGVKETQEWRLDATHYIIDTIENGVKHTTGTSTDLRYKRVEYTIQHGVKETKLGAPDNRDWFINDAIENGVKNIAPRLWDKTEVVENTIQNGEKIK